VLQLEENFTKMRYSKLLGKTLKDSPKDEVSVNAKLLLRGGFIDKLMAGSYTLLHLGRRVEQKIEQIVREEMNDTGAEEILMPLLHPKEIWNETGRWDKAKEVMYQFEKNEKEYALSFTHEEIVMNLLRKHVSSYKDLPIKVYHFSTKFRSEARAKSGILRGREFLMKDLYSAHESEKDLMKYYKEVTNAYVKIFKRMNLDVIVTEAGGGVFTKSKTHEFQVLAESGEDEIIYCPGGDFSSNVEISPVKEGKQCDLGHGPLKKAKTIEVGNIFPLGTYYSEKMGGMFTDQKGERKPFWFASYGIGISRLIGAITEIHSDDKGIVWPEAVAPYQAHLIEIRNSKSEIRNKSKNQNTKFLNKGDDVYEALKKAGIEVLFDDREDVSAGEKFADADLIGIPVRLVVSPKSGDKIEWKKRTPLRPDFAKASSGKQGSEGQVELLSLPEVIKRLVGKERA
jgi:prolyl-tRNA synthetase